METLLCYRDLRLVFIYKTYKVVAGLLCMSTPLYSLSLIYHIPEKAYNSLKLLASNNEQIDEECLGSDVQLE